MLKMFITDGYAEKREEWREQVRKKEGLSSVCVCLYDVMESAKYGL